MWCVAAAVWAGGNAWRDESSPNCWCHVVFEFSEWWLVFFFFFFCQENYWSLSNSTTTRLSQGHTLVVRRCYALLSDLSTGGVRYLWNTIKYCCNIAASRPISVSHFIFAVGTQGKKVYCITVIIWLYNYILTPLFRYSLVCVMWYFFLIFNLHLYQDAGFSAKAAARLIWLSIHLLCICFVYNDVC